MVFYSVYYEKRVIKLITQLNLQKKKLVIVLVACGIVLGYTMKKSNLCFKKAYLKKKDNSFMTYGILFKYYKKKM